MRKRKIGNLDQDLSNKSLYFLPKERSSKEKSDSDKQEYPLPQSDDELSAFLDKLKPFDPESTSHTKSSLVVGLIKDTDFTLSREEDIFEKMKGNLFHYSNTNAEGPPRAYFFINCAFGVLTDRWFLNEERRVPRKVYLIECRIREIHFNKLRPHLHLNYNGDNTAISKCTIEFFAQDNLIRDSYELEGQNTIHYLRVSAKEISLNQLTIGAFLFRENRNIKDTAINAENVNIKFKWDFLKHIKPHERELILVTFLRLAKLASFENQKLEIEKYLNYLESQRHWLKRLLFRFNKGYSSPLWPAIAIASSIAANHYLLDYCLSYGGQSLSDIFFVNDLLKNVVFKDFGFQNSFSFVKLAIIVVEVVFIYSMFSFVAAIKKILGFKPLKL